MKIVLLTLLIITLSGCSSVTLDTEKPQSQTPNRSLISDVIGKPTTEKMSDAENFTFDIDITSLDYQLPTHDLICTPSSKQSCSSDKGCIEIQPSVFLVYDSKTGSVYRCDDQPCDKYAVEKVESGLFYSLVSTEDRDFRLKISDEGGYIETVGLGLVDLTSYGTCSEVKRIPSYEELNSLDDSIEFTHSLLWSLNELHYVSLLQADNSEKEAVGIMTGILTENIYFESVFKRLQPYVDHDDSNISITASGVALGALQLLEANTTLLSILTGEKMVENVDYAVAQFAADNKEGYMTIAISAPQITVNFFQPSETENPSGPIPYTLSFDQRRFILSEINRYFGDDLDNNYIDSNGDSNAILFTVQAIKNNLQYDTYEESQK
jgi:hypothetical protein